MGKLGWFLSDVNRNIPATWRWSCRDWTRERNTQNWTCLAIMALVHSWQRRRATYLKINKITENVNDCNTSKTNVYRFDNNNFSLNVPAINDCHGYYSHVFLLAMASVNSSTEDQKVLQCMTSVWAATTQFYGHICPFEWDPRGKEKGGGFVQVPSPRVECPRNINTVQNKKTNKKHDLWYDDLWNE